MTTDQAVVAFISVMVGAVVAHLVARPLLARPPAKLLRTNYRDERVPAVLGFGVSAGAIVAAAGVGLTSVDVGEVTTAVLGVLVLLLAGGAADDLRGDERAKGFGGHIRAALEGRVTGGFMKILAGGAAGLLAGFVVSSGRTAIEIALLVALSANLFNLLDRAPGRALKVSFAVAIPLMVLGAAPWAVASAGLYGAAAATLPADLRERGMLGDTGANPLGGVLGLGLGVTLGEPGRLVALGVLLALNLASERVSFSAVIERTRFLRVLDLAGRARTTDEKS